MEASESMNQVDQLNGAALAYIGDAIYEVYVRQHVIASGLTQPNRLHRAATRYVEAKGQAYADGKAVGVPLPPHGPTRGLD